jgi:uncharacterized protein GlcG (DUF336 family)
VTITLEQARTIVDGALAHGTEAGFNPLTAAVLDPGGALVALARQDGSGTCARTSRWPRRGACSGSA